MTRGTAHSSRRPRLARGSTSALVFLGGLAAGAIVAVVALLFIRGTERLADLERADEHRRRIAADFARQSVARPPPRGASSEGNAYAAQARAWAKIPSEVQVGGFMLTSLDAGEARELVAAHREVFEEARASALLDRTWVDDNPPETWVDRFAGPPVSSVPALASLREMGPYGRERVRHARFRQALLTEAAAGEPGRCLATAVDSLRMAFDSYPGDGTFVRRFGLQQAELVAIAAVGCSTRADPAVIRTSREELARVMATEPPIGLTWEWELLMMADLRRRAIAATAPPPLTVLLVGFASSNLRAYRSLLDLAPRVSGLTASAGPGDFEGEWRRLVAAAPGVPSEELEQLHDSVLEELRIEAVGRASLRCGLALMESVEHLRTTGELPAEPPPSLREDGLRDPYNGEALRWRREGSTLTLCSVGDDGPDSTDRDVCLSLIEREGRFVVRQGRPGGTVEWAAEPDSASAGGRP